MLRKPAEVDYSKNNGVTESRFNVSTKSSQQKKSPFDEAPRDVNSYQSTTGLSQKENKDLPPTPINDYENDQLTPEIMHSTSSSMNCEPCMDDFILMTLADHATFDKDFYSQYEAHELALFLAMERAFLNEDLELPKVGCENDDIEGPSAERPDATIGATASMEE